MSIFKHLVKRYIEFASWKSDEHLFVLESDDWGMERTRDNEALRRLLKINHKVSEDKMTLLDTIASPEDISYLFEILDSVKDSYGNPVVLTANVCTANPDFDKIKDSGFTEFYFEPFYKTIQAKDRGNERLALWNEGIRRNLFCPQLHGREHVHAMAWLEELRLGNRELLEAFEAGAWGIPYSALGIKRRRNLLASLDVYGFEGEREFQEKWISDSVKIFSSYFNYTPTTFIPPAYTWHSRIISTLDIAGIGAVQGISFQYQPLGNNSKRLYKKVMHINGQRISQGNRLVKLSRNAFFEPFSNPVFDWKGTALQSINRAFSKGCPAILGAHRVNFIGQHSVSNRDSNLKLLKSLLTDVKSKWPDVRFVTSAQLAQMIATKNKAN